MINMEKVAYSQVPEARSISRNRILVILVDFKVVILK